MQTHYLVMADDENKNKFSDQFISGNRKMKGSIIPKNFRILLVDDDEDFNKALSFSLRKKGIDVIAVQSGYKAIKVLEGNSFDLILLDLKMPGMDGVETFKRINQLKKGSSVIIMTAYHEEDQMKAVKELNPFGFLKKPFDVAQLISHIDEIIKEKKDEEGKDSCC